MSDLGRIADRLDAIVEELDEIAFDRLREAAGSGAGRRPADDKEITKARRAVEKASAVLRALDDVRDR